ncbi:hypothetical protein EK21DRAFT_88122 [Setomelanomma holmii]|uniref:Uncharacterized protein n=1 Tax=Setomelanomma holmii TaxID=210430 RepID=A0A9P4LNM8_9PLEO|nr:hypothetical protein EK21DRAFT_88122 [Setomelanomma holmii]
MLGLAGWLPWFRAASCTPHLPLHSIMIRLGPAESHGEATAVLGGLGHVPCTYSMHLLHGCAWRQRSWVPKFQRAAPAAAAVQEREAYAVSYCKACAAWSHEQLVAGMVRFSMGGRVCAGRDCLCASIVSWARTANGQMGLAANIPSRAASCPKSPPSRA